MTEGMSEVATPGSLAELFAEIKAAPGGERLIERHQVSTYTDFVNILKKDIDDIVIGMERNRNRFQGRSEDEITFHIASMLRQLGYSASNGTQYAGSVDLTVEKVRKNWLWTAEAKIFTSLAKVGAGFKQLSTRYSPGSMEEAKAGMIIYIFTENASKKMKTWKDHLLKAGDATLTVGTCTARPNLAFYSTHDHVDSGLPLNVRHIGITLHFKPQDPSGLAAKKYKKKSN